MGELDAKKNGRLRWPYLLPLATALLLNLATFSCVPWKRVHPVDPSLHEAIGYAPFWSHRFAGVAGARIDWESVAVAVLATWVMCGVAAVVLTISVQVD